MLGTIAQWIRDRAGIGVEVDPVGIGRRGVHPDPLSLHDCVGEPEPLVRSAVAKVSVEVVLRLAVDGNKPAV